MKNAERITAIEIIETYLKNSGFDGLVSPGICACEIGELVPCSEMTERCEAGHKVDCNPNECTADGDCDWHIEAGKRPQ